MKNSFTMHLSCMKPFFFLLTLLLAGSALLAQNSSGKLYGYIQPVIPGAAAAKRVTDDAGHVVERKPEDTRFNYFIYLTTAQTTRVYPIEMWIKGQPFSAMPKTVTTPVEQTSHLVPGRPQKTVLVPETTQKVTQLEPAPFIAEKSNAKAASLALENELVVVYKQGGKTYIKTLKTLSELSPKALQ